MSIVAHDPSPRSESARSGQPERVFDPSAGPVTANHLFIVAGGPVVVLASLLIAAPLFVCGVRPFGQDAPPPAVCFGVAAFLTTAGLAVAFGCYRYAGSARRSARAYHLYPDCLVVVGAGGDERRIPWEQIGPKKETGRLLGRHTYPVDGEADLAFGPTFAGHEELADAITRRSTQARWTRLLTPAGASRLSGDRPARAFLVYDAPENLLYRVSPLAGRLLFVRVGEGSAAGTRGFAPRKVSGQGGLAGAAAGWRQMKQAERLQRALDALEGVDERSLFELAVGLPGSRLIAPDELAEPRFAAPSLWAKLVTGVELVGVLQFKHAEWGEKKMYFESLPQFGEAARIFQELLGRDFRKETASLGARA
jgi:hypothetical protein